MKFIARGGKAPYDVSLGILMLEAKFSRKAATWPFLSALPRGARRDAGARGSEVLPPASWATSSPTPAGKWCRGDHHQLRCLSLFWAELAVHVRVPVAASALIQVPWVPGMLQAGPTCLGGSFRCL